MEILQYPSMVDAAKAERQKNISPLGKRVLNLCALLFGIIGAACLYFGLAALATCFNSHEETDKLTTEIMIATFGFTGGLFLSSLSSLSANSKRDINEICDLIVAMLYGASVAYLEPYLNIKWLPDGFRMMVAIAIYIFLSRIALGLAFPAEKGKNSISKLTIAFFSLVFFVAAMDTLFQPIKQTFGYKGIEVLLLASLTTTVAFFVFACRALSRQTTIKQR